MSGVQGRCAERVWGGAPRREDLTNVAHERARGQRDYLGRSPARSPAHLLLSHPPEVTIVTGTWDRCTECREWVRLAV